MRHWKTLAVAAVVAAIALSIVAVAYAQTGNRPGVQRRAGCGALMSNPKALKAMQELRVEHQKEMQAWRDRYGAEPNSAEAQDALRQLRQEHWNDMRALLKKLGVNVPDGAGPGMMGSGAGCGVAGGGGCGGPGTSAGSGAGYGGGMMGGGYGGMMGGTY